MTFLKSMTFGNGTIFIYTNSDFVLQIEKIVKIIHFLKTGII